MRLLLIAYEFPPSPSPQSLRWTYLARELAALGHEVHVLAPDLGGETPGLPALPDSVRVHRTFPGPVRGMLAFVRKRRRTATAAPARTAPPASTDPGAGAAALRPPRNWKQQASEVVQAAAQRVWFPDVRGEWRFWAERALGPLLERIAPDLVISSHEPATTLELGLSAQARGLRWVADLGDPVLAGYVAPQWRDRAGRLEKQVCDRADLVTVTNAGAAELLRQRHGRRADVGVLPQGFDDRPRTRATTPPGIFERDRLELLYTGSFYSFRRADALIRALEAHPALRLSIAAVTVPEAIVSAAKAAPERIRLLGFLPHGAILDLQRRADVLINIANDDATQIPGKFYEYLGAGRPILHLGNGNDPVAPMVVRLRRGWTCHNDAEAIGARLLALARNKVQGCLDRELALGPETVGEYGWRQIAGRLDALLRAVAARA
ncbi:glycosyltransferase [Luteimonas sp. R10]|uniref:glycosyltransferase n=1 Tax=Luteimonas sp. R10 TaxID=3108176 RepID=UPI00308BB7CF|nr:glycosyltransferase [Luteimonas sp. R10]